MSKAWIRAKTPEFVRDVLRDFCLAARALEEQFSHFDRGGQVNFGVLRDLLGEEFNKGLLWRLKDTAHLLFRGSRDAPRVGRFLDWGIGYVFHESMKLKEDAYQQQNYGPWFRAMQAESLPPEELKIAQELYEVILQTAESIRREIARIRFIIDHMKRLLPLYLSEYGDNPLLARLLFERNDLVAAVFGEYYSELLRKLHGDRPERLYVLAAQSLRQGGWMQEAETAIGRAIALAPEDTAVRLEKEMVDSWRKRLKA